MNYEGDNEYSKDENLKTYICYVHKKYKFQFLETNLSMRDSIGNSGITLQSCSSYRSHLLDSSSNQKEEVGLGGEKEKKL